MISLSDTKENEREKRRKFEFFKFFESFVDSLFSVDFLLRLPGVSLLELFSSNWLFLRSRKSPSSLFLGCCRVDVFLQVVKVSFS